MGRHWQNASVHWLNSTLARLNKAVGACKATLVPRYLDRLQPYIDGPSTCP